MFESKNIYVLNKKDPNAIVYEDADGTIIRLTREQFSSEDEFLRFKAWSDENYHEAEKERHKQSNHTLSLDAISDEAAMVCSAEDDVCEWQRLEEREQLRQMLMSGIDTHLTTVQRRRLWLHVVDGLTLREIAKSENVVFTKIDRSVKLAKEKMKKFLKP